MARYKLRIGHGLRNFLVIRPDPQDESKLTEQPETMIPDSLIRDILDNQPTVISIKYGEALKKLRELLEIEI